MVKSRAGVANFMSMWDEFNSTSYLLVYSKINVKTVQIDILTYAVGREATVDIVNNSGFDTNFVSFNNIIYYSYKYTLQ